MAESDLYKTALKRAMAICASREICQAEIKKKLSDWGADSKDIVKIIDHLTGEKFIDEKRYAFAFSKDKFRHNKWGKVKIASVLKMKSIPADIISEALDSIDNDNYLEVLRSIITSHRKTVKARNKYELKGKLLRFGLSKGFESHLIYDLLNEDN
jgi:regulatory protein